MKYTYVMSGSNRVRGPDRDTSPDRGGNEFAGGGGGGFVPSFRITDDGDRRITDDGANRTVS